MAKELIDRDMYDYYRANRKKTAKGIDQYKLWVKAINGLLICLKDLVTSNDNGVHIENFGYIRAEKKLFYRKRVSILRRETKIRHTIKFTPFDPRMSRYKFTIGRSVYVLKLDLDYKEKLDAIIHTLSLKRNTWKKV